MAITQEEFDRIMGKQSALQRIVQENPQTVKAIPRSIVSGTYADLLKPLTNNAIGDFLVGDIQRGLNAASYNQPLTTGGSFQTGGIRPEYLMGALALTPAGKAKKVAGAVDNLGYDMAKIANQYPDIAPPMMAIDKKTGKEFLQKVNSPEAMAVEKARKAAQKEIDKGNYTPYFPLEERYYADAASYPLTGNTLKDTLPKKAETLAKHTATYDTPAARKTLSEAYERGSQFPMTQNWYATGQLENEFIKEYGKKEGSRLYKEAFADAMAATTGGADPTSNLLMSYFGNYMKEAGKELPANAYNMPYPIGGRFASGNIGMYDKVINQGKGLSAAEQPKRFNFSGNFLGYRDKATMDEQMSSAWDLLAPPKGTYGIFENVVQDLAKERGIPAANFQDVTWAGLKGSTGKPMMQHINEAIERTARVTGKKPEDVVRDSLVKRTNPLYSVAPFGLLYDQENQPQFQ
jgi:hypothetical protein